MSGSQGNDFKLMKLATKYRKATLTETQKKIAEEIAYKGLTGKREADIADEYNISRSTIWRWKALPAFNEWTNKIVREYQKSHLVDVNNILQDILKNGSDRSKLKAIELYYRNQGLFKDVTETTIKSDTDSTIDDILKELEGLQ